MVARKTNSERIKVLEFMNIQIQQLSSVNRFGTALNYRKAMLSFSSFLKGKDIHFTSMTDELIADYNTFLMQRGLIRNSISFYMRILRSVYIKAVKQKLVSEPHPFTYVYTGVDYTKKRAINESEIYKIYNLELPEQSELAMARDIFIFSYCTRGMAFIDIVYLKKNNIQKGYIQYYRQKTGQYLTVKIEPVIEKILNKYIKTKSPYIFPVITSLSPVEAYEQYRRGINSYNRLLYKISGMLSDGIRISSYTARHTWATTARRYNVPISIISAGMGHSSELTTRVYLDSLDNNAIDNANRRIIKGLSNSSM